mgnify:CR=1 FL=1
MPRMIAGKIARGVLLAAALASLGGCALADVASGPPPSLYVLNAPAPDMPAALPIAASQIVVEAFSAPAAIDTSRIVFKPSANEIKYYAGARWSDRAPRMIASLLVETLSDTGRRRRRGRAGAHGSRAFRRYPGLQCLPAGRGRIRRRCNEDQGCVFRAACPCPRPGDRGLA